MSSQVELQVKIRLWMLSLFLTNDFTLVRLW